MEKRLREFGLSGCIVNVRSLCIAMCVIILVSLCQADVVSWNYNRYSDAYGTQSSDVSGVVPASYWNDTWLDGREGNLLNSNGEATTIDIAWESYNTWSIQSSHPGTDADGSYSKEILNGYLNAGNASWSPSVTYSSVTLSQIPYSSYEIYVYFSSDVAGREGDVTDGTTTYSFNAIGPASITSGNAVLVRTTDTAGTYAVAANYAVFTGLSGSSQTLTVQMRDDGEWGGIAAIQISGENTDFTAPTPDPAQWTSQPQAIDAHSVTMTSVIGVDESGSVEYYFEETTGHPGGGDSGWITTPTYVDHGLEPMETYSYVVRMRDAIGNVTEDSDSVSVTIAPAVDMDGSGVVDISDLATYGSQWLTGDCVNSLWCNGSDFDMSGAVDLVDTAVLCNAWLQSAGPEHFHSWAATPPMGWNSWDCFGTSVVESEVIANADYMAANLKEYGWEYIVVDIQWYEPQVESYPYNYPSNLDTNIDEYGRVCPAVNKHPSSVDGKGFKPLADYVHGLGLKFGVHMMRGIPKVAYNLDTPILGTEYTARDIADTGSTCSWNPDMYGVDTTKPGAQEYYNSIFDLLAQWGVDYVKIDDLSRPYHQGEIEAIRNGIDQCGRPMVFSTSPGETPLSAGEHVSQYANLWRISDDFWDSWSALDAQFERLDNWSQWNGDGHFPDADMLPLGNVRARSNGWTNFTETEQKTMMILWAIARSPLMMGGDMPDNDAYTLSLLTNSEVLEVNKNSYHGRCVQDGSYPIWVANIPDSDDIYLAVFNRTSSSASVPIVLSDYGITSCEIRNVWDHVDYGTVSGAVSPGVEAHGARLYKLTVLD